MRVKQWRDAVERGGGLLAGGRGEEREGLEAKRKEKREEDGEIKRWDGVLRKRQEERKWEGAGV